MKKFARILLFLLTITVLALPVLAYASEGDTYWDFPKSGVVLCNYASCRKAPSLSNQPERYGGLSNGKQILVLGENSQFYIVDLASTGFANKGVCYIYKKYILVDYNYITLKEDTVTWATPYGNLANGEKSAGTRLLVIEETNDYVAVQLNEGKSGTGFIRKNVISSSNQYQESASNKVLVTANTLAVYPSTDDSEVDKAIAFAHQGDILEAVGYPVMGVKEELQPIKWEHLGSTVLGYVHTRYLMDIYDD